MIDNLNADNREHAELNDVAEAVNQVLENWWDTYFRDLWMRSDQNQRACLIALRDGSDSEPRQIAQQSGLDEKTVRSTLQILLKRDLVLHDQGKYRIATPIYCEWVERNI